LLLKKASDDEALLDAVLDLERVTDEIIGFHCQQAIEKMLKAVLSELKITYRRTHDLTELLDLLIEKGVNIPPEIEELDELFPFAVEFRYAVLPEDDETPFDRKEARELVRKVRKWVESIVTQ
jgi:HEPN domain-containing protein